MISMWYFYIQQVYAYNDVRLYFNRYFLVQNYFDKKYD